MGEKLVGNDNGLLPMSKGCLGKPKGGGKYWKWPIIVGLLVFIYFNIPKNMSDAVRLIDGRLANGASINGADICPIPEKVIPQEFESIKSTLDLIMYDEGFKNQSAAKLANAVRIPTEVTDQTRFLPVDDPAFGPFVELHRYLEKTFPRVHSTLKKETVNKHGLIYTWEGTDKRLKPLLLTAHQDVVPVEWATAGKWSYHPFSGHFDGKRVWGRGSSDCKNLMIGLLESVELLVQQGFAPKRTVIVAFGFDEEASGIIGASHISEFLYQRYGGDSLYALIDEGNSGVAQKDRRYFAAVATGEKGHVNSEITLSTPGGHSSVPPDHTAIGIVSQLVNLIETTPFAPSLVPHNPFLGYLQCYAYHSAEIDPALKDTILRAGLDRRASRRLAEHLAADRFTRYLIATSQAVDIVHGGIKSNALPEAVSVLVNSRINLDAAVQDVVAKLTANIEQIARKFDLGVLVNGKTLRNTTENGYFNYTVSFPLEVAPVSPWTGPVWDLFAGSLRHFYEDVAYKDIISSPLVVTPGLSTGNTDTKYYWKLTRNIYRYQPGHLSEGPADLQGIHSVDEYTTIESHLNIIGFYYEYLRNIDSYS